MTCGAIAWCSAFGDAAGDVSPGGLVSPAAGDHDGVQCAVEGPVAAATEPVPDLHLTGGGLDRGDTSQASKRSITAAASGMGPRHEYLSGGHDTNTGFSEQLGGVLLDERGEFLVEFTDFCSQCGDPARQ